MKKADFDNKLIDVTSYKNELNELSKQFKAISTKVLTKDLRCLVFLMKKNIFLQEYFKTSWKIQ